MADRVKKGGKQKYKKIEYLENKKSFLDEIKNTFHSFWRASIWWKINIWLKIAHTGIKEVFSAYDEKSVALHSW